MKFSAISDIHPPCFIHPHIPPQHQHGSFAYLGHISWYTGKSVQLWDLISLQFKLSPRLPHATERIVPYIAAAIPCSGKNTSGDIALQWGFLRTQHQSCTRYTHMLHGWGSMWQEHQLHHQLEWLLWLSAGEAVAFFQISRSWIFQYWHNILLFLQSAPLPH